MLKYKNTIRQTLLHHYKWLSEKGLCGYVYLYQGQTGLDQHGW